MTLKDLNLKGLYDSDRDNLLLDFYVPVLSESISYKRIAGFFSSNALAISAKGIQKFIENGGKIQLIANIILSEQDQKAIKEAIEQKEKEIISEIEKLDDVLKKGHIRLLAWLIKTEKLEIKIAVVPRGIEHKKKGILEDKEGNLISFSGSENETMKGWLENDEEFHVFCSWIEGDKTRHLEPDIESFDKLWNNDTNEAKVYSISEAFRYNLIRTAPRDEQEFKELSEEVTKELIKEEEKQRANKSKLQNKVELREYQIEAINAWFKNKCKGIFEMATGTGKTYTALACLDQIYKQHHTLAVIIVCPYKHLVTQWVEKDLASFKFEGITIFGSFSSWNKILSNKIFSINNGYLNRMIIATTYDTFSSERFIEQIKKLKCSVMLIADEVHWAGAPELRKGLIENYNFRLGLSATPKRWMDDEGTDLLYNYFDCSSGGIYEFSLKEAITKINPATGETYLCPYEYYPSFVEMTDNEILDYEELTKKIAKEYAKAKITEKRQFFDLLCIQRQNIIKDAKNKYAQFEEILTELGTIQHCLIYCSPKQIDIVQNILNKRGIIQSRFTGEESNERRKELIEGFAQKKYQALVAMKCLDEGVDVPPTKTAIFLASSGNPKEFIQRRGRILRRYSGKDKAKIYDIIVIPRLKEPQQVLGKEMFEIEQNIIKKEFKRYNEFAQISLNYAKALNIALPIRLAYKIIENELKI